MITDSCYSSPLTRRACASRATARLWPRSNSSACKSNSASEPEAQHVGIDLELGRISFPSAEEPSGEVVVSYDYGFAADLGGGPYDRLAPATVGETVSTDAAQALRDSEAHDLAARTLTPQELALRDPDGFHHDASRLVPSRGAGWVYDD